MAYPLQNTSRIRHLLTSGFSPYELRQPHWHHPYHGVARVAGEDETHPLTRILDASALLPSCGCIGGWAALYVQGVSYVDGLDSRGNERPVLLHMCERHRIRKRHGIEPTRAVLVSGEVTEVEDMQTTVIARAVYDEMCRAGSLTEAVVILDMSISRVTNGGRTTLTTVRRLVGRHRKTRGIRLARAALDLASEHSASPWETRTRLLVVVELPISELAVNRPVFDPSGNLLGIPDLLDPESGLVVETDGSQHGRPDDRARDHCRDDLFASHGLTVVRVTPGHHVTRNELVRRLRDAHRRATRRPTSSRGWTLTEPAWWTDSPLARRWG